MRYETADNQSIQALDYNIVSKWLDGTGVAAGCAPSAPSGMDISITSGEILVGGTTVSVASQTVTLSDGDSTYPRKDVVYVDSTGTLAVAEGTPAPISPEGESEYRAASPSPPDLQGQDVAVIAEQYVEANQTSLSGTFLDKRIDVNPAFGDVSADEIANVVICEVGDDVQSKIDEAGSNSVVYLESGTHTASALTVPSSVTVMGAGKDSTTLKLASGADTHLFDLNNYGVTIRGLNIDGNGANQDLTLSRRKLHLIQKNAGVNGLTIQNCRVRDAAKGAAIGLDGGNNCRIFNVDAYNLGESGEPCDFIYSGNNTNLKVHDCYLDTCTDTAVAQDGNSLTVVANNTFKNTESQALSFVKDGDSGIIANNVLENCATAAGKGSIVVSRFGTSTVRESVVVANNTIRGSQKHGIFAEDVDSATISNNTIKNPEWHGIVIVGVQRSSVCDNIVKNAGNSSSNRTGIRMESQSSSGRNSERNSICANNFYGPNAYMYAGIDTATASQNFNTFVANSATGLGWSVAGRGNLRSGNKPHMPLASGTVSIAAGGDATVWSNGFNSGNVTVSIMATSGTGKARWYTTRDGSGNIEYHVEEFGGANSVDVKYAIWP